MAYTNKPITTIAVKFWQHSLAEYWQAHPKLNTQYAGLNANIDDLVLHSKSHIYVEQWYNDIKMAHIWFRLIAQLSNSDIAFNNAIKANFMMSLVCLNHNFVNGIPLFIQLYKTSSPPLKQTNIKSSKINMGEVTKHSLILFAQIIRNMIGIPLSLSKIDRHSVNYYNPCLITLMSMLTTSS